MQLRLSSLLYLLDNRHLIELSWSALFVEVKAHESKEGQRVRARANCILACRERHV